MIRIVQNLRIGVKLAIASALSILLIGLMIFSQIFGNAAVSKANESAIVQQAIARDAIDTKASIRGMQVGVRDVRLATAPADFQKASDYIAARLKSVDEFADGMLKLAHSPENRERITKIRDMAGQYAKGTLQIAAIRGELIGIEAKRGAGGELPAEAVAKIGKLNDEVNRIAAEVTLPIAGEIRQSPTRSSITPSTGLKRISLSHCKKCRQQSETR